MLKLLAEDFATHEAHRRVSLRVDAQPETNMTELHAFNDVRYGRPR